MMIFGVVVEIKFYDIERFSCNVFVKGIIKVAY